MTRRRDASELRAARDAERRFARGLKRPRRSRPPAADLTRTDDEWKDESFRQLSELAGTIVSRHGRDFTVGALLLAARYVAKHAPDPLAGTAPAVAVTDDPTLAGESTPRADGGGRRIIVPGERPH